MAQVENLWGDIAVADNKNSAKSILSQQAKFLNEITKNFLVGEVQTGAKPYYFLHGAPHIEKASNTTSFNILKHQLIIKAPTLGYQFVIVSAEHGLSGYPLVLTNELDDQTFEAHNDDEFTKYLTLILQSPITQKALHTLIAQNI
jgi:hypothetical protein